MSIESDGWFDDFSHLEHLGHAAKVIREHREEQQRLAAAALAAQSLDGLELASASAAAVDAKLKGRIDALFEQLARIADKGDEVNAARNQLSLAANVWNKYPTPNLSQAEAALIESVNVNIQLCEKYFVAQHTSQLLDVELAEMISATRLASAALREACNNIETYCPGSASVRFLGAARHLADVAEKSPRLVQSTITARDVSHDPARDDAEDLSRRALLDLLERICRDALEANKLAQKLEAMRPTLVKCQDTSDILEPVRPTEEEVQRFMMQIEQRMRDRISAHIEVKPLLSKRDQLVTRLADLQQKINKLVEENSRGKQGPKFAAVENMVSTVIDESDRAVRRLRQANRWDQKTVEALSTIAQPNATAYDTKTLPLLREVMQAHAYSLGRRNEARAAERATCGLGEVSTSVAGVVECKSVKQALAWQAQHEVEVAAAAKKNYSREVKLELLKESVRAYGEEVSASETRLHRQTVSLLPGRGVVPCDELRALFNAAASLYSGNDSFEEGRFPIF